MISKTVSYNNCISLSEDRFCLKTKIADLDEMPNNAAFHMGVNCLPLYPFMGYWSTKIWCINERATCIKGHILAPLEPKKP